jgi:beta-galactosidase
VRNDQRVAARVAVRSRLLDADGKTVTTLSRTVDVAPGAVAPVTLTARVAAPRLWRGRPDPYLYRLVTSVGDDTVATPVGFRSIAVDPARGFLLNGQPYGVHGVNLFHAGRPAKGLAVGVAEIDADFAILRDLGATGLRFVHFQHPRRAYENADRDGFLVWTEIPLNSLADDGAAFAENAAEQLRELIRQNYNHPSVVTWGLANELYRSDAATSKLLSGLQAVAKAEDPSRPTVLADCCKPETDPQALHTDLIGQNRYFGWYDGKPEDIGPWVEAVHAKSPDRRLAISEYGAGASVLQQEDPPRRPVAKSKWHPEQYQALFHETYWRALRDKPWLWGTFVWVGFDLASDGRDEGDRPGINDKGLVTYDRKTRKDAYFWYRANWTAAPMVYITSRRAIARTTAEVTVKVYANVSSVSLTLNGRRLETAPVVDHIATWPVTLAPGVNRIAVEGSGVRDSAVWTLVAKP